MTNPVHHHLDITICDDAQEAINQGFNWGDMNVAPIEIKQVIVVRNGTQAGRPTVDFVLEDQTGKRFVFMVTGALLKSIPC